MRVALSLVLAASALLLARADFPEEDDVIVLTDDNFDSAVEQLSPLLVEFYAPWCGHCKSLAPEYAKAAKTLKKEGFRIAKVDATEARKVAERFQIQGFPTLKFFKSGKPTEYTGGRTEDTIVSWIRKNVGPSVKSLDSADAIEEYQQTSAVTVVAFFESETSANAKVFTSVADVTPEGVVFAQTTSPDARQHFKVPASGDHIIILQKFDDGRVDYTGAFEMTKIIEFVEANRMPTVIEFTSENSQNLFSGPIKTHFLLFIDTEDAASEDIVTAFTAAAKEHKGKALFITVGPAEERVYQYFMISTKDAPQAAMVHMPEDQPMRKFRYDAGKGFSLAAINAFVADYFAGSLKPFLKSEEVPATNDGPVKVVVGKSFADIALDPKKDVLLEFYAPWCGHCKQLAPIYERLGKTIKNANLDEDIVIAKIDGSGNEVDFPGVNVRGFPTIFFFPAGENKEAMPYDGSRDIEGFIDFLREHGSVEIDENIEIAPEEEGAKKKKKKSKKGKKHDHHDHDGHDHDHDEL